MKKLIEIIKSDLKRYSDSDISIKFFFRNVIFVPSFKYIFVFRVTSYLKKNKKLGYIFWELYRRRLMHKFGFEISSGTNIGKGFYIGHFGAVTINPSSIIGKHVNVSKGVTIGQINRGPKRGTPTIGNKVWIGVNSTIVGKIIIGNNVLIAPNSYVNFDIPDNSIVMGNPGKVIKQDYKEATKGYL